jgi:hypothetical protein
MKTYKIETTCWVEGHEVRVFNFKANSLEEAKQMVQNFEVHPIESDIFIKNSDNLDFTNIEEIE